MGNIHFSITESDLQNVFEPFGELEFVQLQKEEQGRSRGYGFVQYVILSALSVDQTNTFPRNSYFSFCIIPRKHKKMEFFISFITFFSSMSDQEDFFIHNLSLRYL